jgi:hypothetical protein
MDPLLVATYSSTASGRPAKTRKAEDAFYDRHGGPVFRRAFPAVPAVALTAAFVVVAGLLGQ